MPTSQKEDKKKNQGQTQSSNTLQNNAQTQTNNSSMQGNLGNQAMMAALQPGMSIAGAAKTSKYLNEEDILKRLVDSINTAKTACNDKLRSNVGDMAKRNFGYMGGLIGKHKSDAVGYDLRIFLKEKARDWAREHVNDKKDNYITEKNNEIDQSSNFASDEERNQAKENISDDLDRKSILLKTTLYKDMKQSVVDRLEKESNDICDSMTGQYENEFDGKIRKELVNLYKETFTKAYSKRKKGMPEAWSANIALTKARETTLNKSKSIGIKVFNSMNKAIIEEAQKKIESRRETVINMLGGKIEDNRANFDGVQKDDYKAVNEYIFEQDEDKAKQEGTTALNDMTGKIKNSIETNEIVAPNVNKGLLVFTKPIVALVPHAGDSVSASGIIRIPIADSGAYVSLKLSGEAEKDDDDYVTAKFRVAVGAGGTAGIAKLHGELGGFMEIKGKSSEDLAMLLSYMMYRQARESKIFPHQVTNAIWGMGGKSGEGKHNEAEAYGATMETKLFGDGAGAGAGAGANSATIGVDASLGVELGDMSKGLGGEMTFTGMVGREYSKTSFEDGKGKGRLGKIEAYKFGGQKSKGDVVEKLSFEGAIGGGLIEGGIEAEVNFRGTKFESVAFKLSGSLKNTGGIFGNSGGEKAVKVIHDVILHLKNLEQNIKKVVQAYQEKKLRKIKATSDDAGKVGGEIALFSTDLGSQIKEIADSKDALGQQIAIADATNALELAIEYEWEPGSLGKLTVALNSKKSLELDAEIVGIELERSRRLASWTTGDDMQNLRDMAKAKGAKDKLKALGGGASIL
ncbi:hypothetical protein R9X47_10905 [Wukongibacter baidiensis]|uniref:hypothetical protein n=1 Tax=Wukongibacter baidiensis TaxID=1723361 RepID=UPI003D7F5C85